MEWLAPSQIRPWAVCACLAGLAGLAYRAARIAASVRAPRSHDESEIERRANERHLGALGSMTAVFAHEIRNPLAALKGHAQLLLEGVEPGTKAHTRAERVVREAVALEQLTTDLLTFVRSGSLRRDPTDVRLLVRQAVEALHSADVRWSEPSMPVVVSIDRVRFLQMLDNLLRNAMQHGKPPVEVRLVMEPRMLALVVRDHGKGVSPERVDKIFEPFETDATRGTGLGLAVVRRVAELHGGSASVTTAEGGGAQFTVRFPLRLDADAAAAS